MTHWLRQLFRRTPVDRVANPPRTRLGLSRLEERDTPATFTVNNLLDDLNPGSLRWAVGQANSTAGADTITFNETLNGSTVTLGGTRLEVQDAVTITGPSRGVTIDGNNASQVFYFDGRTFGTYAASLSNLTITRGRTLGGEEVIDGYNSGSYGGGILNDRTSLTLENVTVSNNVSTANGGGIYNWEGVNSKLTLRNSLITGNSATVNGGGIYNWTAATITAVNTTFSGNLAGDSGGGILQDSGGAITLTNVTATLNRADSNNNASGTGGFLYIFSGAGAVTLHNTIVSGNLSGLSTADEIFGTVANTSSNNVIFDTGTAGGLSGTSNNNKVGVNPLLGALADNGGLTRTHALLQNSPALGAGSASVTNYSPFDQRGTARDNGPGVQKTPDAGAYEVQHPLAPVGVPTTLATLYVPKPSASANEAFVKGLYQATVLRAADTAGLNGWLTSLAAGMTREEVAKGFVNSVENRSNQVNFFYRYFLGREADTAGLNFWVDMLRGGTDEGSVMTGFILSAEFSANNDNTQFVNLMYYSLLSRAADTTGLNGWLGALSGGTSREVVVNAFLRSDEGINRVVGSLFQTYLKRPADTMTLETFRAYLKFNRTFGDAAILMLGSNEFHNNAGNNLT